MDATHDAWPKRVPERPARGRPRRRVHPPLETVCGAGSGDRLQPVTDGIVGRRHETAAAAGRKSIDYFQGGPRPARREAAFELLPFGGRSASRRSGSSCTSAGISLPRIMSTTSCRSASWGRCHSEKFRTERPSSTSRCVSHETGAAFVYHGHLRQAGMAVEAPDVAKLRGAGVFHLISSTVCGLRGHTRKG